MLHLKLTWISKNSIGSAFAQQTTEEKRTKQNHVPDPLQSQEELSNEYLYF